MFKVNLMKTDVETFCNSRKNIIINEVEEQLESHHQSELVDQWLRTYYKERFIEWFIRESEKSKVFIQLEILERKESIFMILIDLFSLPIILVGKWLSAQWVRYNVIVVLINFLIEMPFQSFVEFLEQWRAFLKEKKEEIH